MTLRGLSEAAEEALGIAGRLQDAVPANLETGSGMAAELVSKLQVRFEHEADIWQPGTGNKYTCTALHPAALLSCVASQWRCAQEMEGRLAGDHQAVEQCHQCLADFYRQQAQNGTTASLQVSKAWEAAVAHKLGAIAAMQQHYGAASTQVAFEQIKLAKMTQDAAAFLGQSRLSKLSAAAEQHLVAARGVLALFYGEAGDQLLARLAHI